MSDLQQAISRLDRTPDVLEEIASRIAAREPMWNVARFYGMTRGQLSYWLTNDAERAVRYATALRAASHDQVQEALDRVSEAITISDEQSQVERIGVNGEGTGEYYDPDVPRDRLRVDARLKGAKMMVDFAGIVNPAAYGQKQQVQLSGSVTLDAVLSAMESAGTGRLVGNGRAE